VVVTTLEAAPAHEAEFFVDALTAKKFSLGAVVFNKVLPSYLRDAGGSATRLASDLEERVAEVAAGLAAYGDVAQVERVLTEVTANFLRLQLVAQREAEQENALGRKPEVVASVPYFESDIFDLRGLLELGQKMWS
jgi:anion-transporting  ArsA/GET3 family ATPase